MTCLISDNRNNIGKAGGSREMLEKQFFMDKRSWCAIVCLNVNNSLLSILRSLLHQRHGSSLPLGQLHGDPSSRFTLEKSRDEPRLCPSSTLHPIPSLPLFFPSSSLPSFFSLSLHFCALYLFALYLYPPLCSPPQGRGKALHPISVP